MTLATARPDLVWPAVVPAEQAVRKVARRAPGATGLTARLYHHPFLGLVFVCGAPAGRFARSPAPVAAHVVVDLVGGRAFLGDPWDEDSFVSREAALRAAGDPGAHGRAGAEQDTERPAVRGPAPRLTEAAAIEAGRALLAGALVRRRRLGALGPAELHTDPLLFGKPNWWVTGRRGQHGEHGERRVEVIVDALNGRHYACSG